MILMTANDVTHGV